MKKFLLAILLSFCLVLFFTSCKSDTYKAGTYTASAKGYAGDVLVEVEFDKNSIVSIKIIEQDETVGFGDKAIEQLPDEIIQEQTWEVDAVTSATVTSEAIKAAVQDCVNQAKNE